MSAVSTPDPSRADPSSTHSSKSSSHGLDRVALTVVVASGSLTAHQLGYLAAAQASHGYISIVGPLVILAAFITAWVSAVRILRGEQVERDWQGEAPSLARLSSAQVALFVSMEIGERAIVGALDSVVSLAVLLGLLLQPIIAFLALRLVALSRRILEWVGAHKRRFVQLAPICPGHPSTHRGQAMAGALVRPRGPPD